MPFDGIVTKSVIAEIKDHVVGAKVNKVYQPTKNEIVLRLYNNGLNYALLLSSAPESCRICLTDNPKQNPSAAPNFCMLLRKHLGSSRILSISNMDLERTAQIKFEGYVEDALVIRKLYIEIMSRQSNIILTDENDIILGTLKHVETSTRDLSLGRKFEFTPITKQSFIKLSSVEEFIQIINSNDSELLSQKVQNSFIGISKVFVANAMQALNIQSADYSSQDLEKLYNYIKDVINGIGTSNISCVNYENDFTLALNENTTPLNINFFIDDFYFSKEQESTFTTSRNNLLKIISATLKKEYKKLENINSKLKECAGMDKYKLYGELLTANLYKIKDLPNTNKLTLENYYDNNNPIEIPLDISISIKANINKFFKKYNKLKNALTIVTAQKEETEKELDYIQSIVYALDNAKTLSDIDEIYEEISENLVTKKAIKKASKKNLKKKKSKGPSITLYKTDIDGFTVYIGKNNLQNDYLTLKFAHKNDYWFHAQKIHGSHVILKTNGSTEIPYEVLVKCARLAKENSKANNSSNVPVDYCEVRHVKKASGAKPGMVIYTNQKTIYVK